VVLDPADERHSNLDVTRRHKCVRYVLHNVTTHRYGPICIAVYLGLPAVLFLNGALVEFGHTIYIVERAASK